MLSNKSNGPRSYFWLQSAWPSWLQHKNHKPVESQLAEMETDKNSVTTAPKNNLIASNLIDNQ